MFVCLLGGGSNLLICDEGIFGFVVRFMVFEFVLLRIENDKVIVSGGV